MKFLKVFFIFSSLCVGGLSLAMERPSLWQRAVSAARTAVHEALGQAPEATQWELEDLMARFRSSSEVSRLYPRKYIRLAELMEHRNPNIAPSQGETPLMLAASGGDLKAVKQFIQAGANINAQDANGRTALYYAASNIPNGVHELQLMEILKNEGSDADFLGTIAFLMQAGADSKILTNPSYGVPESPLMALFRFAPVNAQTEEIVKKLIQAGIADPNEEGDAAQLGSKTLLTLAAAFWTPGIIKLLLDSGSDINKRNSLGETALMYAAGHLKLENMKLLLESGADVLIRGNDNRTALAIARQALAAGRGSQDIVNLLSFYSTKNKM